MLSVSLVTLNRIDFAGFVQSSQIGFGFNGESNLDLQFGMALVGKKQKITLYQVGDDVEGQLILVFWKDVS